MEPKRALALVATIILVTSLLPATTASHQQVKVPPQETGIGHNDVRDEPDHVRDANGFDDCTTLADGGRSCQGGVYTQVLDGHYESNYVQVDVDWNNLLRIATAETGQAQWDDRIYPGTSYFNAYWGWWFDKGSGARLNGGTFEYQGESADVPDANPEDSSNGAIDDGHDDHANVGFPQSGSWDEFIWRGKNPWAGQHSALPVRSGDPGIQSFPGDSIKVFVDPGTHRDILFPEYMLLNEYDSPQIPDLELSDRTNYGAYTQKPVPQFGGWVQNNGFMTPNYDMSLLMATQVQWSVNPADASTGPGFNPDDADATDVDIFSAVHPVVEDAYRTTVWNPDREYDNDNGTREDTSESNVAGDGGAKQIVKDTITPLYSGTFDATNELYDNATGPVSPAQGAVDDASGSKPFKHEPNVNSVQAPWGQTYSDNYPGASCSADPCAGYGGLAQDYYRPTNLNHDGYNQEENAWLDIQTLWGQPAYAVAISSAGGSNFAPIPSAQDVGASDDRTHTPGFLYFAGNFGTWYDENGDTFVGNLDEYGRTTSSDTPYRNGDIDDPNDYTDHDANTNSDPAKKPPAEWNGLTSGGSVTVEVTPLTDGKTWGPTGVYIFEDSAGQFNPYDDIVDDTLDDQSRYVREGTITLTVDDSQNAPKQGNWFSRTFLMLPAGNPSFDILVESQGTVQTDITPTPPAEGNLNGQTVTDVDVVDSWT